MKQSPLFRVIPVLILAFTFLYACSDDNDTINNDPISQTLIETDKAALLFMLEEEKLARDTYIYLNDLWSINQFSNIKNSEQSHMNAVENLLIVNNIDYSLLPIGEFENQTLQEFYDQFIIDGATSVASALYIGATIEDLDIKDLQDFINITVNPSLIALFERLQCGSRNHLRSFVNGIENSGDTYMPQFLTEEEYNAIITATQEQCN